MYVASNSKSTILIYKCADSLSLRRGFIESTYSQPMKVIEHTSNAKIDFLQ